MSWQKFSERWSEILVNMKEVLLVEGSGKAADNVDGAARNAAIDEDENVIDGLNAELYTLPVELVPASVGQPRGVVDSNLERIRTLITFTSAQTCWH
jgi:hypothetical protein